MQVAAEPQKKRAGLVSWQVWDHLQRGRAAVGHPPAQGAGTYRAAAIRPLSAYRAASIGPPPPYCAAAIGPPSARGVRAYRAVAPLLPLGETGAGLQMGAAGGSAGDQHPFAAQSWSDPRPPPARTMALYTSSTDTDGLEAMCQKILEQDAMIASQHRIMDNLSKDVANLVVCQSPDAINSLASMDFATPINIQPLTVPKTPMDFEHVGWWKDVQTPIWKPPSDIAVMEAAMARARQQAAAEGQQFDSEMPSAEEGEQYFDAQTGSGNAVGGWS